MSGGKWWLDAPEVSPLDVALQAEGVSGKLAELARSIYAQESSSGKNTATSNAGAWWDANSARYVPRGGREGMEH